MRLFTGISIPSQQLDALAGAVDQLRAVADLNWSPPANHHITTKFIGEWPEERLSEVKTGLTRVRTPPPFEISLRRFGFFPNPHRPHTFFAGVQAGPELKALAAQLDGTMAALGCEPEKREYSPHLTLARIKGQDIRRMRELIAEMGPPDFGAFRAEEFHLYVSRNLGRGSVYTILESYPLSGAAVGKEDAAQ